MKKMKKKIAFLLVCVLLTGILPFQGKAYAQEQETFLEARQKAVSWLENERAPDGSYGEKEDFNDTCDAVSILNYDAEEYNEYLSEWIEQGNITNNDMLARYVKAVNEPSLLSKLINTQNDDGGYGLTGDYESDVWDSLLILETYTEEYSRQVTEAADNLILYLCSMQNEDGGWSYNEQSSSDRTLTARTGYAIMEYVKKTEIRSDGIENRLKKTDSYLLKSDSRNLSQEIFQEKGYLYLYTYIRNLSDDSIQTEQELVSLQKEDGSFFDSIRDTVLAVKMLDCMAEKNKLVLDVTRMETELSTYVVNAGESTSVTLEGEIDYSVNKEKELNVRISVLDNETILSISDQIVTLDKNETTGNLAPYTFSVFSSIEDGAKQVTVLTELYEGDILLAKDICTLQIKIPHTVADLTLKADVTTGKDYEAKLSWNDISNEEQLYGYHVLRRTEDTDWETRSSWDGEEKVKVLNVYPKSSVAKCLINWMEQTVSNTEEPAGKGLFDIDVVYIDEFNKNPDGYLKDGEGQYQYDVLFFGSYDENGRKDLSEVSYQATEAFLDSGHGVLFGHDTISMVQYQRHPVFSRFAERLGVCVKDYHYYNYSLLNPLMTTKVNVVNNGFLTSYPWKLSGTLNIATTHPLEQYVGGTLDATVWMEFPIPYSVDETTGAKNNGYLFTRSQLAMIQTGHTGGRATDDERKILANTLFYLKQSTEKTSVVDHSFYDEAKPLTPNITLTEQNGGNNVYSLTTMIHGEDEGTSYEYCVEGINKNTEVEAETVKSNMVEATACSGLRGYVVGISGSEEAMPELITYEADGTTIANVVKAEEGTLQYEIKNLEGGHDYYLHVYAVDWENNVSEEAIQKISLEKMNTAISLNTSLEVEKAEILPSENLKIYVNATSSTSNGQLTGILELLDENGLVVDTIDADIEAVLTEGEDWTKDYSWSVQDIQAGNYIVRMRWYQEKAMIHEVSSVVIIRKDGKVCSQVRVRRQQVPKDGELRIEDSIRNTSSNAMENDLLVTYGIYNGEQKLVSECMETIQQLLMKDAKEIKKDISLTGMEPGIYTVKSMVYQEGCLLTDSECMFTITEPEKTMDLTGEITAYVGTLSDNISDVQTSEENPSYTVDESEQTVTFDSVIFNQGETAGKAEITVSIIQIATEEEINEFTITEQFAAGDTKKYQHIQETSGLEGGTYLAVLSVKDCDAEERILDVASFQISRQAEEKETPEPQVTPVMPEPAVTSETPVTASDLVLFTTENSIVMNCEEAIINGEISTANNFEFGGSCLTISGKCSAGNKVIANGWKISIQEKEEAAVTGAVPEIFPILPTLQEWDAAYFNNTDVTIDEDFIQEDSITLNANTVQAGTSAPAILCSLNGDITVNATSLDVNGLLYAPNGTVYINTCQCDIKGKIIAKEIRFQGGKIHINVQ